MNSTDTSSYQPPRRSLPPGACDTHAHVFGPYGRFPLAEPRPYTPAEAPKERYFEMLDAVGFDRGVLVHGGAHGWDHSATLDAIAAAPHRLRGVGVLPADADDSDLTPLHHGGIRGLRFTDVASPNAHQQFPGRVGLDALYALAPRMRRLGWHAVVWANASVLERHADDLRRLGLPIVIDHLGYFDVAKGPNDPAFRALLGLIEDGTAWVKLTAFRNSKEAPAHQDVRPFHDLLVRANPARLLWGSDWPFLGMNGYRPTPGALLDMLNGWLTDADLWKRVLVTNPQALYGFE